MEVPGRGPNLAAAKLATVGRVMSATRLFSPAARTGVTLLRKPPRPGQSVTGWLDEGPISGVFWLPSLDVEPSLASMDAMAFRRLVHRRVKALAERFASATNVLYLGRGYNFPVALEGALKLKEISYIHAEGYPAAEMKHGPIALIDDLMPVVFVAPRDAVYQKVVSNVEEVKARGGKVIAIVTKGDTALAKLADHRVEIPETLDLLTPILSVLPLQLMAYYIAVRRGYEVNVFCYEGAAALAAVAAAQPSVEDRAQYIGYEPIGSDVAVRLPDSLEVTGAVTAANAAPAGDGSDDTVILVEVTLAEPVDEALLGATADVVVEVDERVDVLTVPVNALLALAGGGHGLEVVTGDSTTTVPVETGLFAAGRVEVSGDGIDEGTVVVVAGR